MYIRNVNNKLICITTQIYSKMVKTYYRNEYTEKQWRALVDKAADLSCQVTYSRYGDCAEIDSTKLEDILCKNHPESIGTKRHMWAEHIHRMLQESTRE